jgi:restriction endonuclease S subunit
MERYEKYKDSGIDWIAEIPEHWNSKKFKYLFTFVNNKIEIDLPKIGLENIESKTGKFIESNSEFEGDGTHFREGDILYGKLRPYLAKVFLANFEGKAVGDFFVFRPRSELDNDYSQKLILSQGFIDITNSSTFGSKMPRVSPDFIANLVIYYPPLEEQKAIASYLEHKTAEIDRLIAQKERLIELYEEEKTAIINEAVTKGINPDVKLKPSGIDWLGYIPEHWENKKFKYLFSFVNEKSNIDLPKIGLENIESKTGKFIESNSEFEGDGTCFKQGDILYGKLRPYLAKVWLADFRGKAIGDFFVFRPKSELDSSYSQKLILSQGFIDITNSSTFGSKMPRVSPDFIADLQIYYPPIGEQKAIALYIEKECARINTKIAKTKRIIELQKEYRTALISEAVTGKIKVPTLVEEVA